MIFFFWIISQQKEKKIKENISYHCNVILLGLMSRIFMCSHLAHLLIPGNHVVAQGINSLSHPCVLLRLSVVVPPFLTPVFIVRHGIAVLSQSIRSFKWGSHTCPVVATLGMCTGLGPLRTNSPKKREERFSLCENNNKSKITII